MSKRLKKRIVEVCGLTNLSREDKARRARDILNDNEEKQRVCNELIGTSFKDIEKALQDIVNSKKFSSREELEEQEILDYAPEKIHGPIKPTMAKNGPAKMSYLLDVKEVNRLIAASETPAVCEVKENAANWYNTYTSEEVVALLNGNYDPSHFNKRG